MFDSDIWFADFNMLVPITVQGISHECRWEATLLDAKKQVHFLLKKPNGARIKLRVSVPGESFVDEVGQTVTHYKAEYVPRVAPD